MTCKYCDGTGENPTYPLGQDIARECPHCSRRHVVPINDLRPHIASPQCFCRPFEDEETPGVWIHNSADGREVTKQ